MLSTKIRKTISLLSVLVILAALGFTTNSLLNNYHDDMLEERQQQVRNHVNSAYALLEYYAVKADKGSLTEKQAKDYAAEAIRIISPTDTKYYWINDTNPTMIMHPNLPELNGTDLSGYKGPNDRHLFLEMTKIAKIYGEGFIQYSWSKPSELNKDKLFPKISYIKLYEPWGWIVGSGVYVDDIKSAYEDAVYLISGIFTIISFVVFMLGIFIYAGFKKRKRA